MKQKSYTVNVVGRVNTVMYHTYYSEYTNITAIEVKAITKNQAIAKVRAITGNHIAYIFE